MSLSQVVPAESEEQEDNTESIDLFEVLEDRYAYEGFNKFAFYCFMFFATFQMLMSVHQSASDVPGHINIIRSKLIPPSKDLFERKEPVYCSALWVCFPYHLLPKLEGGLVGGILRQVQRLKRVF